MSDDPVDDLYDPIELPKRFDYDEWLESVEGETVRLTAPAGFPELARCFYMPPWTGLTLCYCEDCDEFSNFVSVDEDASPIGRCPLCGKEPGLVEVGTQIPDDLRRVELAGGETL